MTQLAPYTYKADAGKVFIDSKGNVSNIIVALTADKLANYQEVVLAEYRKTKMRQK